jgi:hypothetical protein
MEQMELIWKGKCSENISVNKALRNAHISISNGVSSAPGQKPVFVKAGKIARLFLCRFKNGGW